MMCDIKKMKAVQRSIFTKIEKDEEGSDTKKENNNESKARNLRQDGHRSTKRMSTWHRRKRSYNPTIMGFF